MVIATKATWTIHWSLENVLNSWSDDPLLLHAVHLKQQPAGGRQRGAVRVLQGGGEEPDSGWEEKVQILWETMSHCKVRFLKLFFSVFDYLSFFLAGVTRSTVVSTCISHVARSQGQQPFSSWARCTPSASCTGSSRRWRPSPPLQTLTVSSAMRNKKMLSSLLSS